MKRKKIKTLVELFDLAGSSTKLAAGLDLHAYTVENWRRSGVPGKYWDLLIEQYDLTPNELFAIRVNCRESNGSK